MSDLDAAIQRLEAAVDSGPPLHMTHALVIAADVALDAILAEYAPVVSNLELRAN